MVQQPNFFGQLEDAELLGEITHAAGAKYIMGVNPISLAVLKTPGECGADIAVGEGQPLGLDTAFGGPYLGFMTATSAMMRKLPGPHRRPRRMIQRGRPAMFSRFLRVSSTSAGKKPRPISAQTNSFVR